MPDDFCLMCQGSGWFAADDDGIHNCYCEAGERRRQGEDPQRYDLTDEDRP